MRELTTLLDRIVEDTIFDAGRARTLDTSRVTTFDGNPENGLSPTELRDALERSSWHSEERVRAESARPVSSDRLLAKLIEKLRQLLTDYILTGTDRVRHTFPMFGCSAKHVKARNDGFTQYEYESTVPQFAVALIRCAAIVGSDRAVSMLSGWIDGEPFQYRRSALLVGVTTQQRLDLGNGIRVTPLAISSDALPTSLPKGSSIRPLDYLGRAVLSVDSTACPAIFRAGDRRSTGDDVTILSALGNAPLETLYEALSLTCNRYVHFKWSWDEYEEVSAFAGKGHGDGRSMGSARNELSAGWSRSGSTGVVTLTDGGLQLPCLSQEVLKKAWNIHSTLDSRKRSDSMFRTAVSRWIRSTRPDLEITDHFIDLRIALEALYLDQKAGELTFRLAIRGAWHLGNDWSERSEIQNALKKFYGVASKIVHGNDLNESKGDHEWLEKAREICRCGILKTIEQKEQPCWDELILGRGME